MYTAAVELFNHRMSRTRWEETASDRPFLPSQNLYLMAKYEKTSNSVIIEHNGPKPTPLLSMEMNQFEVWTVTNNIL